MFAKQEGALPGVRRRERVDGCIQAGATSENTKIIVIYTPLVFVFVRKRPHKSSDGAPKDCKEAAGFYSTS